LQESYRRDAAEGNPVIIGQAFEETRTVADLH